MKLRIIISALICIYSLEMAFGDEKAVMVPTLEELHAIVGSEKNSKTFGDFIKSYGFYENHKRDNSWGSWHGVFLELGANGILVGIRPPSDINDLDKSAIALPMSLKAGDSIAEIKKKLGEPISTDYDPKAYYEMRFNGLTVYTMDGKLFEIWLTQKKAAEQAGAGQPATRPESKSEDGDKPQPEAEGRSR